MTHKEALYNPDISLEQLCMNIKKPEYLYKYQPIYGADGSESLYWRDNIRGAFHLSLGKLLKTTYIPLFIKSNKWAFEHEYRLFLLKHRNISDGMLRATDFLDEKSNLNLREAIHAIYLGPNFIQNPAYEKILSEIECVAAEMKVEVYNKLK